MRLEELKSPGRFKGAQSLRLEVFKAISFAEVSAGMTANTSAQAKELGDFFLDAAERCYSLTKEGSPLKPTKKTKE